MSERCPKCGHNKVFLGPCVVMDAKTGPCNCSDPWHRWIPESPSTQEAEG